MNSLRPSRPQVCLAALAVAALAAWLLLYHYWYLAGDDYQHTNAGGHLRGEFTAGDWWSAFIHDWSQRNGRFSDAVVRLVLRPGEWFFPLLAPVLLTVAGVLVAVAAQGHRGTVRMWVWAAGILTPAVVMAWSPGMFGAAAFWASGAMNYLLPLVTTLGSLVVLARAFAGRLSWAWVTVAAAVMVLNDALHEMSAAGQMFMVLGMVAVHARGWRTVKPQAWALCGIAVVVFVVHMSAPGMWRRAGEVSGNNQGSPVESLVHSMSLSASTFLEASLYGWLVLGAVLVLLAVRGGADATTTRWTWAAAASVGLFVMAGVLHANRSPQGASATSGMRDGMWGYSLMVVATVAACAIVVAMALWSRIPDIGLVPMLAWLAMFGNALFVFGGGLVVPRVFLPMSVLLVVVILAVAAGTELPSPAWDRVAAVGVATAMAVPVFIWADTTRMHLAVNREFVAHHVERVLERAAHRKRGKVTLPLHAPYVDLNYNYAFLLPRYDQPLRDYYGISPRVRLVNDVPVNVR